MNTQSAFPPRFHLVPVEDLDFVVLRVKPSAMVRRRYKMHLSCESTQKQFSPGMEFQSYSALECALHVQVWKPGDLSAPATHTKGDAERC